MNPTLSRFLALAVLAHLLLFAPMVCVAQDEGSEDLHQYFDDNGLSTRKNLISTDVLAPLYGAFTLRYERGIGKHLSLEFGVSKLLPFYIYELPPLSSILNGFYPTGGWGFSVAPHFFFDTKAPERSFIGPKYALRMYNLEDESIVHVQDFTFHYGYNMFLGKHLVFCYQMGMGYRRILHANIPSAFGPNRSESRGTLSLPWVLGIGVMF
jgi:hypothetical protein